MKGQRKTYLHVIPILQVVFLGNIQYSACIKSN